MRVIRIGVVTLTDMVSIEMHLGRYLIYFYQSSNITKLLPRHLE